MTILMVHSTILFAKCSNDVPSVQEASEHPFEPVLSAGALHTCFLNKSRLQCWGDPNLGNCDPPTGDFRAVSSGHWHTCAIDISDRVRCFGSGYALHAQPPLEPVSTMSAGFAFSCAVLQANKTLSCWGAGVEVSQVFPHSKAKMQP